MGKMIEIPEEMLLKSIDTRTLVDAVLNRITTGCDAAIVMSQSGVPAIGQPWPAQGGTYAGMCRGRDGERDYHLIVADEENDGAKWQAALKWAEKLTAGEHKDFTLPYRAEQAILFGNVPELFQKEYYWSRERLAEDSGYAWCQSFYNGNQNYSLPNDSLRARAVRRLVI